MTSVHVLEYATSNKGALKESTMCDTQTPPPPENIRLEHIITAAEAARNATRHAETITQSRLYNCLFCESILILAWATVFAVTSSQLAGKRSLVLACLSGLNLVISLIFVRFGIRAKQFVRMHVDVEAHIERLLPEPVRISQAMDSLRIGRQYTRRSEYRRGELIQVPWFAKGGPNTIDAPILIPGLLAGFSLILFIIPFLYV